jgi:hypothetical protein
MMVVLETLTGERSPVIRVPDLVGPVLHVSVPPTPTDMLREKLTGRPPQVHYAAFHRTEEAIESEGYWALIYRQKELPS